MSEHKPECPMLDDQWPKHPLEVCEYCEMIAACEKRVFQEQIAGRQYDMVLGYQRGLAVARRAVQMVGKGRKGRKAHELWRDALAAIDALREGR